MADGIQRKLAIIVNGDIETRHLQNVENAIHFYQKKGFETHVLNPLAPRSAPTQFLLTTTENLDTLIAGLSKQMDGDDILAVYVTGHGDQKNNLDACIAMDSDCYSLETFSQKINALRYRYRSIYMDQCFSGNAAYRFMDDKTTLLALGSPGETVSCQLVSPYLFSDQVPDSNNDGIFTIREHLQYALAQKGYNQSIITYYEPNAAYDFFGKQSQKINLPQHSSRSK